MQGTAESKNYNWPAYCQILLDIKIHQSITLLLISNHLSHVQLCHVLKHWKSGFNAFFRISCCSYDLWCLFLQQSHYKHFFFNFTHFPHAKYIVIDFYIWKYRLQVNCELKSWHSTFDSVISVSSSDSPSSC